MLSERQEVVRTLQSSWIRRPEHPLSCSRVCWNYKARLSTDVADIVFSGAGQEKVFRCFVQMFGLGFCKPHPSFLGMRDTTHVYYPVRQESASVDN